MGHRFVGTFPKALVGKNHLVVTIDHFTKGIEIKAFASITIKKVKDFFYEDAMCLFEIPKNSYFRQWQTI